MTSSAGIDYTAVDGIAAVTINRPERRNAIDTAAMLELAKAIRRADADDDVRVVVVTGAGADFCAGGDLAPGARTFDALDQGRATSIDDHRETGGYIAEALWDCRKISIAAINGPAVGIGLTLTLPMDIRLASNTARLGAVFVRRGIVPDACAAWFLPRLVGMSRAIEWACSGRLFSATEAREAGLVRSIHEPDELLPAAYELARDIAEHTSPVAVALTRQMLLRTSSAPTPGEAHRVGSWALYEMGRSPDAAEGVSAFLEKRAAKFEMRVSTDMPSFYPWWGDTPFS